MTAIVYPNGSANAAAFPAIVLQYRFFREGITVPLSIESVADASEVVIRETSGMETGAFSVQTEDNKLIVTAADMFGFSAAADYLTEVLFADGKPEIPSSVSFVGKYDKEMLAQKTATNRVIFHNVWFHDLPPECHTFYGLMGAGYLVAEVMAYRPDVVGFNEILSTWRRKTDLVDAMRAIGYEEALPENCDEKMMNPLFYNTRAVKLLECKFASYGTPNRDENGYATDKITGKYYAPSDNNIWKSAVVGAFESLETGKRFVACCTHLEANSYTKSKQPEEGDPARAEQVRETLVPLLNAFSEKYDAPAVVGGDFNSTHQRAACRELEKAGFVNTFYAAEDKKEFCSCHGYPTYCPELNTYVAYDCPWADKEIPLGYDYSIDQMFAKGDLRPRTYRTVTAKPTLYASDHSPVMLDFDL
ncbi:MAG: endonuclease/exonuclease/phosphatase family protein [Clostridia bacterium]|nr:endonuclease/exonuclease/phosphatase family protein [Clostridia bacterium]